MAGRVVALAIVAVLTLVAVAPAEAGEPVATLSVSSVTIPLGEEGFVELRASVPEPPGLGAWHIDVTYDTAVVAAIDCDSNVGVCSPAFSDDTVTARGGPKGGILGDLELARFRFRCADRPGTSPLTIAISVFADATAGDPQDMSGDTEVVEGRITCAEQVPTTEPAPTATPPAGLPDTGTGGGSRDRIAGWAIAALAGLGVLSSAAAGVWVRRRRTSG